MVVEVCVRVILLDVETGGGERASGILYVAVPINIPLSDLSFPLVAHLLGSNDAEAKGSHPLIVMVGTVATIRWEM